MRLLLCALLLSLSGCAVLGSKEAAVACQIADGITTKVGMSKGAVETNALLKGLGGSGILAFKIGLAVLAWLYWDEFTDHGKDEAAVGAVAVANVITCGAAASNLRVIGKQ